MTRDRWWRKEEELAALPRPEMNATGGIFMNRKRCSALFRGAGLLALSLCLATTVGAEGEPFKVQWPEGWEVERRPGPAIPGKFVGEIWVKSVEGGPALLVLSYFPRQQGSKANLEEEIDKEIQARQKRLQNLGMAVTVVSRKAGVLGGHPSYEAEISATGQGPGVRIWFAKTVSREYLYDFSYTGIGDGFERHHGAFEATLRSLALQ